MCNIKAHPIYQHYEFNRAGQFRVVGSEVWLAGKKCNNGYYTLYLSKYGDHKGRCLWLHRAVWEAFYGDIPEGYEIDHIDKNPANNAVGNLRCVTRNEHRKARDHSFIKKMVAERKDRVRPIKSFNKNTGEKFVFANKSRTARYFGCSPALVYAVCEGKAKTFGGNIKFEYTQEEVNKIVPRKKHKCKYNTDEERKAARKQYALRYREKKKALQKKD